MILKKGQGDNMSFSYERYNELVKDINHISKSLQEQTENNYKSFKVEDCACQLISKANSLCAYIRHSKKRK